jgi:hypothetical protein
MRMGHFITLLSETYGLHQPSVAAVTRVMREAGWLTTGARGVNAPEMTHRDAARMTLALLSGEPPGKVVEEFEFLRRLEARTPVPATGFAAVSGLDQAHCLEDGLIWLFALTSGSPTIHEHGERFLGSWLWPHITVSVDASARAAQITYAGHSCAYEDLARDRELDELSAQPRTLENWTRQLVIESRSADWDPSRVALGRRMRVVRTIAQNEISAIADAVAAPAPTIDAQD